VVHHKQRLKTATGLTIFVSLRQSLPSNSPIRRRKALQIVRSEEK
jgi:hypothetical protein